MVGFSPIVANKQHPAPHSVLINKSSNRGEDLLRQAVAVLRDALARRGTRAPGRNGAALAASAQGLAVYLLTPCVDPEELENELGRIDALLAERLADTLPRASTGMHSTGPFDGVTITARPYEPSPDDRRCHIANGSGSAN